MKKHHYLLILIFFSWLVLCMKVMADNSSTYSAEIAVITYAAPERELAFVAALKQVIASVARDPDLPNQPQFKNKFNLANTLVQSYSYIKHPTSDDNKPSLFLQVQFDPKTIQEMIKKFTVSSWTGKTTSVLIWLVRHKNILDESNNDAIIPAAKHLAQNQGVNLIFPSMDLQEMNSIKSADVCEQNIELIRKLSSRYHPKYIILGCIKDPIFAGKLTSKWLLLSEGKTNSWEFSAEHPLELVKARLPTVLKAIPKYHGKISKSAAAEAKDAVVLKISKVNGLDQYAKIVELLRNLKPVVQVDLINIEASVVEIKVTCVGGASGLAEALSDQDRLVPQSITDESVPGVDLEYMWNAGE